MLRYKHKILEQFILVFSTFDTINVGSGVTGIESNGQATFGIVTFGSTLTIDIM